jgi:hypothetical protein
LGHYENLDKDEELALPVDPAIRAVKKDGWRKSIQGTRGSPRYKIRF